MATCVLALSPSIPVCIWSLFITLGTEPNNSDSLANFKSFIGNISTDFRHIWLILLIKKYFMVIFYVMWLKFKNFKNRFLVTSCFRNLLASQIPV